MFPKIFLSQGLMSFFFLSVLALGGVHDCELTDDYCKRYFLVGLLLREVHVVTLIYKTASKVTRLGQGICLRHLRAP